MIPPTFGPEELVGIMRRVRATRTRIEPSAMLEDRVIVVERDPTIGLDCRTIYVPAYDGIGDPHPLARWARPAPGYTRHTLGAREAARMRRRARR